MTGAALPARMRAVVLTGHGDLDRLVLREDRPLPVAGPGEVLVRVGACGLNNTDINTRTAWYSPTVRQATAAGAESGFTEITVGASTWGGSGIRFPRIQGADVAGEIVAVGTGVAAERVGQRVLVDPWLRDPDDPLDRARAGYLGSERDGGFAEYVTVPAINAYAIDCGLSDAELATFPCSWSTGEYLLGRARLGEGETVLVTGASGGVGSAMVQLARRRGARVIAIAGADKLEAVRALGAEAVIARDTPDLQAAVRDLAPGGEVDVVADVVGGAQFPGVLGTLRRGGRYATSGAIAGPIVELDLRTLYLRDLELHGATVMPPQVFADLVGYIERGEVRPVLASSFPLERLREAQVEFIKKAHVGNLVVVPDGAQRHAR